MSNLISAAVVGTGFIGPVHVEALRRAGVRVAGIVGSSPARSSAAAAELGLPAAYETFDDILADRAVDAVHLTSPNRWHYEQASRVLQAGKHVMCEKPLAMNSRESGHLLQLAEDTGRVAAVAYNIRFYPLCHEAAARLQTRDIGSFLHVQGSYVQDWLLYDTDFNWRVMAEEGGPLRAVADIGTHWLDLIQFITGHRIISVCADLRTVHATRSRRLAGGETFSALTSSDLPGDTIAITTEDCGCVMLRFEGGANGCLWVSQTTAGRRNCLRFEIAGTQQSLAWNSEEPNTLWIGHRSRANETLIRDPSLMGESAAALCSYPGGHNEGFPETFKQLFCSFYDYLRVGDWTAPRHFPTFADGHHEVLLCEAILRSHQRKAWVDVGTLPG